jgi:hypothetical protein
MAEGVFMDLASDRNGGGPDRKSSVQTEEGLRIFEEAAEAAPIELAEELGDPPVLATSGGGSGKEPPVIITGLGGDDSGEWDGDRSKGGDSWKEDTGLDGAFTPAGAQFGKELATTFGEFDDSTPVTAGVGAMAYAESEHPLGRGASILVHCSLLIMMTASLSALGFLVMKMSAI